MATTSIEWARNADGSSGQTWNPVAGCTIVSPGCKNCYAMRMAARLEAMGQAKYAGLTKKVNGLHVWTGKIALDDDALMIPLKRKKATTWFVNSMSDLFHEGVPFEFVDRVFAVMALTPQHTYQILTKRPERMREYLSQEDLSFNIENVGWSMLNRPIELVGNWPLKDVWLGTSVEDEKRKKRIDDLRSIPAAIRFLSLEPLIEDLGVLDLTNIDWVIVGGESGPGARPCNVEWIRSIVAQCKAAGVACFVKQLGAKPTCHYGVSERVESGQMFATSESVVRDAQGLTPLRMAGWRINDSKGGDIDEWPEDLRVREMPACRGRVVK